DYKSIAQHEEEIEVLDLPPIEGQIRKEGHGVEALDGGTQHDYPYVSPALQLVLDVLRILRFLVFVVSSGEFHGPS
ncbi:hypothetical protein PMAYCL1PPCAC_31233, partial [Pristionchus mayeri]